MNTMREDFEAWCEMRCDRDAAGEYASTPVRLAWAAWQAARQPVGEAVGFESDATDSEIVEWFTQNSAGNKLNERVSLAFSRMLNSPRQFIADKDRAQYRDDMRDRGARGFRYAAPPQQPAQVDLGQFRELAQDWERRAPGGPFEESNPAWAQLTGELLALIDSQESKP